MTTPDFLKAPFNWLAKNLSSDSTSSNSRALQSIIVVNIVVMLWFVLVKAHWYIHDNTRLVLVCLIVSGAGGYIGGKWAPEKGRDPE